MDYNLHSRAVPLQFGNKFGLKNNHRASRLDTKWEAETYTNKAVRYPIIDVYEFIREHVELKVVHRNPQKLCVIEDIPTEPKTTESSPAEEGTPPKEKNSVTNPLCSFFGPWFTFNVPSGSAEVLYAVETNTRPEEQRDSDQPATTKDALILWRSERSMKGKMPGTVSECSYFQADWRMPKYRTIFEGHVRPVSFMDCELCLFPLFEPMAIRFI